MAQSASTQNPNDTSDIEVIGVEQGLLSARTTERLSTRYVKWVSFVGIFIVLYAFMTFATSKGAGGTVEHGRLSNSISAVATGRNLVVLFDGTGCHIDKACDFHEGYFCDSNIVDLYRLTTDVHANQLTKYMSGVGTDDIGYSAVSQTLDKASGESVNMRAELIYRWIVENYQPGDKIFAFGHSRGTISARVLQGMIHLLGVSRPSYVDEAIEAFYKDDESIPLAFKASSKSWPDSGTVEFVGLFEAVLRTIIATKNIENLKQTISPSVKHLAHAMGLGEWRKMYEVNELIVTEHTQANQVWFMGQHGNIGGNVENGINDIAKAWMIDQAKAQGMLVSEDWAAGLKLDAQSDVRTDREVTGADSNGWAFRNPGYCRQAAGFGDAPIKVHKSVKDRMELVPGWVPPQWCCSTYDFIENIEWVSNPAYDNVEQGPVASRPQWVRVVLGELKNAKTRAKNPTWYARVQMWHSSKRLADGTTTDQLDTLPRSEGRWGDRTYHDGNYPIPAGEPKNIFCRKSTATSCDFANDETEKLPLMPAEAASVNEFLIEVWDEYYNDDGLVGRFVLRYDDPDVIKMLPRDIDGLDGDATFTAKLEIYTADDPVKSVLGDESKPAQCTYFYDVMLHRSESHMCSPIFNEGASNSYKENDPNKCATFIEDITCNRCFKEQNK